MSKKVVRNLGTPGNGHILVTVSQSRIDSTSVTVNGSTSDQPDHNSRRDCVVTLGHPSDTSVESHHHIFVPVHLL